MGDVIVVTNSPPIGLMRSQLTNLMWTFWDPCSHYSMVYNLAFTLNNRIYVKKLQEIIPGSDAGHIRHPEWRCCSSDSGRGLANNDVKWLIGTRYGVLALAWLGNTRLYLYHTGCPTIEFSLCFACFLGFPWSYRGSFYHFSAAQETRIPKLTLLSSLYQKLIKLQSKMGSNFDSDTI